MRLAQNDCLRSFEIATWRVVAKVRKRYRLRARERGIFMELSNSLKRSTQGFFFGTPEYLRTRGFSGEINGVLYRRDRETELRARLNI